MLFHVECNPKREGGGGLLEVWLDEHPLVDCELMLSAGDDTFPRTEPVHRYVRAILVVGLTGL